ncbi:hypothetical protein ABT234_07985 [Streptomyces sp. NPDC001586]|uniref:hypothetical protein n=1 Tax=Streptomyces sp. NPDC001586 TaxID=3154387 RepID=UPI00332AD74A
MKVILFGAPGMVGQGVLSACLEDPDVTEVLAVARRPLSRTAPKLRVVLHSDFTDLTPIAGELAAADACFYCLGVSAAGRDAAEYETVTYTYTLAAARTVAADNPTLTRLNGAGPRVLRTADINRLAA